MGCGWQGAGSTGTAGLAPVGGGQTQLGPVDPLQDKLAASLGKCTQEEQKKKQTPKTTNNKPTKTREQKEQESAEGTPRSQ